MSGNACTSAHYANLPLTELRAAILQRRERPNERSPYDPTNWSLLLDSSGLSRAYPNLIYSFLRGFIGNNRTITHTFTPLNAPNTNTHPGFRDIVATELESGRWIGPSSAADLTLLIGPFQSSPCAIIDKPHKPGKVRLVQNFSFPQSGAQLSINSSMDIADFPCTWGSLEIMAGLIISLPPGTHFMVRDIKSAYRTIALAESEWPGMVVRISEDSFALDTHAPFGWKPAGGLLGQVADAACDLMRWKGFGPILKWVDDHVIVRLRANDVAEYNQRRAAWRSDIQRSGGGTIREVRSRGSRYFEGCTHDDNTTNRFVEDFEFPVRIIPNPGSSTLSNEWAWDISALDAFTTGELGIQWAPEKDLPPSHENTYHGVRWNTQLRTAELPNETRLRYLEGAAQWQSSRTHTLHEAQTITGRLQHLSFLIPNGRAYLSTFYAFIHLYHAVGHDRNLRKNPEKPLTPARRNQAEIAWWIAQLQQPRIVRHLPRPTRIIDIQAYSDASSTIGIGIYINHEWRAWQLREGWDTRDPHRDIQWGEAVGVDLLARYIFTRVETGSHVRLWCDSQPVVGAWRKGYSRNTAVNDIIKELQTYLDDVGGHIYLRYVESAANYADAPSRFDFTKLDYSRMLPPIPLPDHYAPDVLDFDPRTDTAPDVHRARPCLTPAERTERVKLNLKYDATQSDHLSDPRIWWE